MNREGVLLMNVLNNQSVSFWKVKVGNLYFLKGDYRQLKQIELTIKEEEAFSFCSKTFADSLATRLGGNLIELSLSSLNSNVTTITEKYDWEILKQEFVVQPSYYNH